MFNPIKGDNIQFTTNTTGLFEVISPVMEGDELFDAVLLEETVNKLIAEGKRNFSLDLSSIDYLYSDSINKFINLNHKILNVYGRLTLLTPSEQVSKILSRSGVQNFLKIYNSIDELEQASQEIIQQTSTINIQDIQAVSAQQQAPVNEFEDLRSEISDAMEMPDANASDSAFSNRKVKIEKSAPQAPAPQVRRPQAFEKAMPTPKESATALPEFDQIEDSAKYSKNRKKASNRSNQLDSVSNSQKKKSGVVPFILFALVLIAGAVGGWFYMNKSSVEKPITNKIVQQKSVVKEIPQIATEIKTENVKVNQVKKEKIVSSKPVPKSKPAVKRKKRVTTPRKKSTKVTKRSTAKKTNKITMTSSPSGAKLYVDGKFLGTTPYVWNSPSAYGMVNFKVTKNGYKALKVSVEYTGGILTKNVILRKSTKPKTKPVVTKSKPVKKVVPKATAKPVVKSTPKPVAKPKVVAQKPKAVKGSPATIFISSLPPMADVYLDGVKIGKTNIQELKVTSGTHQLKFVKGAKQLTKSMTFKPGKNSSQLIRLK